MAEANTPNTRLTTSTGTYLKYSSIENGKIENLDPTRRYILFEKVHGSNLQVTIQKAADGRLEWSCGNRSGPLNHLFGNFFSFQKAFEKYHGSIASLYQMAVTQYIAETGKQLDSGFKVIVYGEIYGGLFPNIPTPEGHIKVQARMAYCPHVDFCIFDIKIVINDPTDNQIDNQPNTTVQAGKAEQAEQADQDDQDDQADQDEQAEQAEHATKTSQKEKNHYWLNMASTYPLIESTGFIPAPHVFTGTPAEIAQHINIETMTTRIPSIHGLPELPNNFVEGVVIRPETPSVNGTRGKLIKWKHPKFDEIASGKIAGVDGKKRQKVKGAPKPVENTHPMRETVLSLCTLPRMESVHSKNGATDFTDKTVKATYMKEFAQDVYEDAKKYFETPADLDKFWETHGKQISTLSNKIYFKFVTSQMQN